MILRVAQWDFAAIYVLFHDGSVRVISPVVPVHCSLPQVQWSALHAAATDPSTRTADSATVSQWLTTTWQRLPSGTIGCPLA